MRNIQLVIVFLIFSTGVLAQSYSKFHKTGEVYFDKKDYKSAIDEFSKALNIKSTNDKSLNFRGLSYLEMKDFEKAALDFKKAADFKPEKAEYHYNLGRSYYELRKYTEAVLALNSATERSKKMIEAHQLKIKCLMLLKQFDKALESAKIVLSLGKTGDAYTQVGLIQDSLKLYKEAIYNFGRASFYNSKIIEPHIGKAYAYLQLKEYDKAIESADKSLTLDDKNVLALLVRSDINIAMNNVQKAVDDVSKIVLDNPDSVQYIILRGKYYQKLGQHQNAISDYSKAILLDKENHTNYYKRAVSYEAISDLKLAKKDYKRFGALAKNDKKSVKLYEAAKKRLYELNKESNNPKVVMVDPPLTNDNGLEIPKDVDKYVLKGRVIDESVIASIQVGGKEASFNKDTINPFFEIEIDAKEPRNITFNVSDTYNNSITSEYKILKTEIDPPVIKLMAPYASDDGTVYLESDDPSLYVEGVIEDESLIKSILIEGSTAAFVLNDNNPKFSATVNIRNKDDFTVVAEDKYGNKTEKKFYMNRENIELLANNPMGKTWVVFIENSGYESFASLDGPTKDVTMMKSAFAKYKIHNVVHKKDMTKSQIERFFSIELRDLVRTNRVNSLLVWYAGHGKFINETGYWIPTDAKRDDEFTYFNINNLKASMQSYSKYITHTLVITDACESGPSFYQAMRSTPKDKSCNDWQATKFKSSQVFSSAGYELASDNSQFTKTFATALSSNPNSCMPIETVVTKVRTAVSKEGGKQKPKFGKIAGLEDENGTFFFIKK